MQAVKAINTYFDTKMGEMCNKVSLTISKSFDKLHSTLDTNYRERDKEVVFVREEQAKQSVKSKSNELHVPPSSGTPQREPVHVTIELCDMMEKALTTKSNKLHNSTKVHETQKLSSANDVNDTFETPRRRKGRLSMALSLTL